MQKYFEVVGRLRLKYGWLDIDFLSVIRNTIPHKYFYQTHDILWEYDADIIKESNENPPKSKAASMAYKCVMLEAYQVAEAFCYDVTGH